MGLGTSLGSMRPVIMTQEGVVTDQAKTGTRSSSCLSLPRIDMGIED